MRKAREAVAVHHDVIGKVVSELEDHRKVLGIVGEIVARTLWGRIMWLLFGR